MDRNDVLKIMSVLRGAFPQFYKDTSRREADDIVSLWEDMFRSDNVVIVGAAVKAYIEADESGYPPSIGQIKARIRQITQPKEMTEGEAWALVAKAIKNSGYEAGKEFDALPENIQRLVGSPSQLFDWSQMDSDTVHSVIASNFQRSFRARQKSDREYAALPADVKAMIGGIADRLSLGE